MRLSAVEVESQKERIIQSAQKVFCARGYAATKMEDIAQAAEISRSPLYYHYKNKESLFTAVVARSCGELLDNEQRIFSSNEPIFEKIRRALFSNAYYGTTLEKLRTEIYPKSPELTKARAIYEQCRSALIEIKQVALRKAAEQGELRRDCSIDVIIDLIFFFHRGLLGEVSMREPTPTQETYMVSMINEYVALLRTRYGT